MAKTVLRNASIVTIVALTLILIVACAQSAPAVQTPPKATPSASPSVKPTAQKSPAEGPLSFAGKTVTIVVPYAAGAATDIIARLYGRYLPRYLPGSPIIIARNIPGGNATIGASYVYNSSKPDGLTLLVSSGSGAIAQLFGMSSARYDMAKMPPVMAVATATVYGIRPGIIDKPEDLPKAKGLVYGESTGSLGYIFIAMKELLGFQVDKVFLAYAGSGEARRAYIAGETNLATGTTTDYWVAMDDMVKKGELMLLFQSGIHDEKGNLVKDPGLPSSIMTGKELYEKIYGKTPSGIEWQAYNGMVGTARSYDKLLTLPPGTPEVIIKAYWEAAQKVIEDPEFQKTAQSLVGDKAVWTVGKSLEDGVKRSFAMDPAVIKWLKETMAKHGVVV